VPLSPTLFKKPSRSSPREAIDFERVSQQGKRESGLDRMETLRQEVASLSDFVKEELRRFCDTTNSVPTLGGVACCQRALEQVRGFFAHPLISHEQTGRN
jgi:hypothetical protein